MALHEQCVGKTDEWYTPPHVFEALGERFATDVASPGRHITPWIPAVEFITGDSLSQAWPGFVWMNPPFGGRNGIRPWLERFFIQNHGIALTPDRTSAPWWQEFAPKAAAILFVAKKLKFIGSDGKPGTSPAQGTCLFAAGPRAVSALQRAEASGLGFLMTPAVSSPQSGECRVTKAPEIEQKDGLYVSDAEIIRRWGIGEKTGRVALRALEKIPAFPKKRELFGGRRYWPAVKQFIDAQEGVSVSAPATAPVSPEQEEPWNATKKARDRARSRASI